MKQLIVIIITLIVIIVVVVVVVLQHRFIVTHSTRHRKISSTRQCNSASNCSEDICVLRLKRWMSPNRLLTAR